MARLIKSRLIHWIGLAVFSCLMVVGCVAQQADVVRVKRDLDRKISELDKSKTSLQQAVAEANRSLLKANSIIAEQRTEIKTLLQARADLNDQMSTIKDGDLSQLRGAIDENQHQLQDLVQQIHGLNQGIQGAQQEAQNREKAIRPIVEQLQGRLTQQEDVVTTQAAKITEFRTSLVDFQQALTGLRETMVQQNGQSQDASARVDEVFRKQLSEAQSTTANFEEVKRSINSVVSALEKVSSTLADRLDEHERKLTQVSRTTGPSLSSSETGRNQRSAEAENVTRSVQKLRQDLNALAQNMNTVGNYQEKSIPTVNRQIQHNPSPSIQPVRTPSTVVTNSPSRAKTFQKRQAGNPDAVAYQEYFALLRAGKLNRAIDGFSDFLRQYPESHLVSNAQYWLGECYYGQRRFAQAIQEFEQVFNQYPSSNKVPAALLKIGYSNLELQKPATARAIFRQLVRSYPKSPEAAKAYSRLTEVDGLTKRPS